MFEKVPRFFLRWWWCQRTSCCCRLVESCAGGTLFGHMVQSLLSLYLSLVPSLSRSLLHSYPLEALHLPCPKLFTFYFIIFFYQCFRFFFFLGGGRPRGISGSPTRSRLITLSDRCGLFPRIEADELIFSAINFDPVNHSADTWNIFRTAIDSEKPFYISSLATSINLAQSRGLYYCTLRVNRRSLSSGRSNI